MINKSVCGYSSLSKDKLVDWEFLVSEQIMNPQVPIALRMSGHILLGVVCVYSKKVEYLHPQFSSPHTPPVTIDGAQDPDLNHGIGASHSSADNDNLPTPERLRKQNRPKVLATIDEIGMHDKTVPPPKQPYNRRNQIIMNQNIPKITQTHTSHFYPLCTLLVFYLRQHAFPVAWIMTQSVAKCDISKWLRALLDRMRAVNPTWKVVGMGQFCVMVSVSQIVLQLEYVVQLGIWFQCISGTSVKGPGLGLYDTDGTSVSSSSVDLYSVRKITSVIK
ncbi:zinc finger, SWIM-type containing protein [Tanacetum coccineum]